MEHHEVQAIIAAILASGASGGNGVSPVKIVDDYRRILKQLESTGGPYETERGPASRG